MSEELRESIRSDLAQMIALMPKENLATMQEIAEIVAEETGVPLERLMKKARNKLITGARHYCFYKMYEHGYTYPDIAKFFGMDHTSIVSAADRIRTKLGLKTVMKKRGAISPVVVPKADTPLAKLAAQENAAMRRRYK